MSCPWWLAYTFDNPFRRLFHKPETIFSPNFEKGMTAVDLGCGMGIFHWHGLYAGDTGKVISVDIQQKMLDVLRSGHQKQVWGSGFIPIALPRTTLVCPVSPVESIWC